MLETHRNRRSEAGKLKVIEQVYLTSALCAMPVIGSRTGLGWGGGLMTEL